MFPKYINTNVFANQGILLIHYESLPNNGAFIINNLKTNFEKVVLFSTQNNNALFIPDLSEFVSTNRIALVLCDEDRTVLALHSLCVYVGSFYNYSFNLPDFYCFVYEINYPISRCIVNNYTFYEKEKTVSNNKNHLYTPSFESINNRITKYYIKNTSNGSKKELPTSTINAEVITSNQKDCDECFDIEREPKQVSEIIDTNTTPFTYFPTLDLQFDIPTKLSTASELDLITKISESDDARRKQYYVQHIKTSAESLMITPQTFSANVNLKPKQIKIIEENKKRHEAEKLKKDNEYMRKLYVKYKNGDDDTKLQIITKKYNEYVTNRIQLLSLEFYYNQWILENRKKEIDESLLLDVYKTCLYVVENGTEKERDYAMEKLREVGFDNTVDELKYKIENNLHKVNKQNNDKGKRSDDKQNKRDVNKKERIESENTDNDKENKTNDKLPYKVRDKDLYFQLKYAGHYLKRSTESRPDSRVNFTPDGWQIKLLDSVDNNNSSIICAPTSSGKTFICYYAIEKVLKGAETDVVIFCLPTKALVNQVMADIYARFSTKTYKHKALQGILMKDYQVDPWKSQILILTPLMLETLLSSLHKMESNKKHKKNVNKEAEKQDTSLDALAAMVGSLNVNDNTLINNIKKNNFTLSNIKYIIIDEVHMICTKEMGTQIQRIVHMSPSPLLLLSATLGNLDIFYKWMESIENSKGRKCELVQYKERYCEIRNYVYHKEEIVEEVIGDSTSDEDHCMEYKAPTLLSDNKDEETESGKDKEEKEKKREVTHRIEPTITPINPLFGYSVESLVNNNFSVELTLLPDQLLDIFYTMYDVSRDKRVTKGLRPQSFFKSNIITKKDVKDYQLYMFETIKEFYRDGTITHEQLNEIYDKLVSNSNSAFESAEKEMKKYRKELAKAETNDIFVEKLDTGDDNKQNIMQNHIPIEYNIDSDNENSKDLLNSPLMKDVKSMDNLTHIDTSSYDLQYMLDNITDLVLLLKKQDLLPCIIFNTDRSICDLLAEKVYADLEEMERREAKVVKKKKEYKRPKEILKKDEWIEDTLYEEENIKDIVNYRVDPKFCLFNTLYRKSDYELADVYKVTESMFYRGIGVHHNGKNKKTRLAVETLFRAKHVACVFSTETLSLGINMPCKTVVFAGDYKLSVVEYKQMAGRAGRRGFDLMGNVVFFGMNKIKARNLMMSEVSNMRVNSELMCNTSLIGNDAMRNSILKDSLFEINYGGNALQFNKPCVVYGEKGDKTNGDTENTESICENKNDSARLTSVQECVKTKYINSTGRKDALSDYLNKFDRCEYTLCPTCHKESNEEMMSNDLNLYDAFSNPKFRYLIFDIQKEILLKHNIVKNNEKQLNREDEIEKRVNITNDLIGRKMLSLITLGGKEYISDHEFKIKNDLSLTKFADILISGKEQDPQMLSFIIFLQYLSTKKIPITEPKDLIFYIAHFFEVIPTVDQNNALKEFTMPDFVRYINTLYYDSMALLFNSKLTKIQNKSTDFLFNLYIFPSFDLKMKNSYLIDFFEHGKVEAIRKNNNIGIKTLWASCYVVDSLLEKLNESGDKTVKATYELFHNKFKKIFA